MLGKVNVGGGEVKLTGNAQPGDVLAGKTFYNTNAKQIETGSIQSLGATTYTPTTTNQTIASGQYLSGTQTIKGDANLVAGNIASGKSIFGVSGTYAGGLKVKKKYTTEQIVGQSWSGGLATYTVTLPNDIDYSKSELRFVISMASNTPSSKAYGLKLSSANLDGSTLTLKFAYIGYNYKWRVRVDVIQYENVKSVQKLLSYSGYVTPGGTATSSIETFAISEVDPNKTIVTTCNCWYCDYSNYNRYWIGNGAVLNDSTSIAISGGEVNLINVIEFN